MSVVIDYFFNYPKDLQELAADINTTLGCNLSPYEGDPQDYFSRFLSMEFSLSSSEYLVNDRELDFENFRYELGFRTPWGGADARPIQLPAILLVIYALHRWLGITGMLVYDVQILLARYVEREIDGAGRRLFDVISSTPFLSFQAHLDIVKRRLPDDWQGYYGDKPGPQEDSG